MSGKQFQTRKGVIIQCDIPIKQYILFLNDEDLKAQKPALVMEDLDSTHLLVAGEFLAEIKARVSEFVESNSRPPEKRTAGGARRKRMDY
ncbi:hypothetical protein BASA81_008901 [Batrachochytrium salamandrivorans]|nr:hypothetical protein BASA81_008901 [Batrachochytrium salamandrivorans]